MKFRFIRLKNYIGIYNGLGLDEIYIDFTKCKYKKIVIKGDNGSGKSTLFNAIHPLPDSNDCFVPEVQAEKEFGLISDNGIDYHMFITHPVKDNGDRSPTKAFIRKFITETLYSNLNPTGNVGTYKEALFNEFNLDPNFIALSQISSEDRGLADKTPSERKKFINSIIECLEVYNNINKTLVKRSSIFKAMINSLTTKIDNIGDENKIQISLGSIEDRINKLTIHKDMLIKNLAESESIIKLLDPDLSIQKTYECICSQISELDIDINKIENSILDSKSKCGLDTINIEEINKLYKNVCSSIDKFNNNIYSEELYIKDLLTDRENEARDIQLKTRRLETLNSEYNFLELEKAIQTQEKNIIQYETLLTNIGFDKSTTISKDEYIIGLNTLKEIKDTIDVFRSNMNNEIIQASINSIIMNIDIISIIATIQDQIDNLSIYIDDRLRELSYYEGLSDQLSLLEMRPKSCQIDGCSFISQALEASKLNPNLNINELSREIDESKILLNNLISDKNKNELIQNGIQYINIIIRNIKSHSNILSKLPNGSIFSNKDEFLEKLANGSNFNEINTLYKFIDCANIFEMYSSGKQILHTLRTDYKIYESKNEIIEGLSKDIEQLNNRLNGLTERISNIKVDIFNNKRELEILEVIKRSYEYLINNLKNISDLNTKKHELVNQFNSIKNNMIKIKEAIDNTNSINSDINNIIAELEPLIKDRDKIKYSLTLLQDYKNELVEYNEKYNYVETIKHYSSPTTGIQTVFMKLYMDKTLSIANDLLSLLFDGEFILGRYIINEDEFRIPCIGSGLPHDDISSMSTSQICMISMILSFSLLYQSSTKYNILKLDEIDGGLDNSNRLQFTYVFDQLISMLKVEQSIMISHNVEMNLSNADLIILKMKDQIPITEGNIIYKYEA
jgi:DNA repair exonuclease SbcCD ATPase subunit